MFYLDFQMDLSSGVSLAVVGGAGVDPSVLGVNVGDGQTVVQTDTGPGPELSTSMCMEASCHKDPARSKHNSLQWRYFAYQSPNRGLSMLRAGSLWHKIASLLSSRPMRASLDLDQ